MTTLEAFTDLGEAIKAKEKQEAEERQDAQQRRSRQEARELGPVQARGGGSPARGDSMLQTKAVPFPRRNMLRSMWHGGRMCSHCGTFAPERRAVMQGEEVPFEGLNCTYITDSFLAMARPNEEQMAQFKIPRRFRRAKITALINLCMPGEHPFCGGGNLRASGFPYNPETFMNEGVAHYSFSWKDMGAPTMSLTMDMMHVIGAHLGRGEKVAVHCHAGLGRTGVTIACALMLYGISKDNLHPDADEVITLLRTRRKGSVQSPSQELFIRQFYRAIQGIRVMYPAALDAPVLRAQRDGPPACQHSGNLGNYAFSLEAYVHDKQAYLLFGEESVKYRHVPKVLSLCLRVLQKASRSNPLAVVAAVAGVHVNAYMYLSEWIGVAAGDSAKPLPGLPEEGEEAPETPTKQLAGTKTVGSEIYATTPKAGVQARRKPKLSPLVLIKAHDIAPSATPDLAQNPPWGAREEALLLYAKLALNKNDWSFWANFLQQQHRETTTSSNQSADEEDRVAHLGPASSWDPRLGAEMVFDFLLGLKCAALDPAAILPSLWQQVREATAAGYDANIPVDADDVACESHAQRQLLRDFTDFLGAIRKRSPTELFLKALARVGTIIFGLERLFPGLLGGRNLANPFILCDSDYVRQQRAPIASAPGVGGVAERILEEDLDEVSVAQTLRPPVAPQEPPASSYILMASVAEDASTRHDAEALQAGAGAARMRDCESYAAFADDLEAHAAQGRRAVFSAMWLLASLVEVQDRARATLADGDYGDDGDNGDDDNRSDVNSELQSQAGGPAEDMSMAGMSEMPPDASALDAFNTFKHRHKEMQFGTRESKLRYRYAQVYKEHLNGLWQR
uniref:Tyrosine specific protein phosphatases domain-containing protein n=1 Tax=Phaeomonas parva TaxID=124430 RepID=A0A7S1UAR0_9STRA|mmetsp:Transcript_36485/g.114367  ORF Transcript_36485/g.114367 Transcript_36485/m.114367 type:complete len:850 (+) Transcript_36485:261-2810(+)